MGTIAKIDRALMGKALDSGYHLRTMDLFPDVDAATFLKTYRERDAVTLSLSMVTLMVEQLRDFVKKINELSSNTPFDKIPTIEVNFHGYKLPDTVRSMILSAIHALINDRCKLEAVDYSNDDLTPEFVRHTYDHMVIYDLGPWLENHAVKGNWGNKGGACPDLTIFTPLLWRGSANEIPQELGDSVEKMAGVMAPFFNLIPLPVEYFCLALNPLRMKINEPSQPEGQESQSVHEQEIQENATEQPVSFMGITPEVKVKPPAVSATRDGGGEHRESPAVGLSGDDDDGFVID